MQLNLALRMGFEPMIFAVKGRCPKPLDERSTMHIHLLKSMANFLAYDRL
jgi:hypothetical protein